MTKSILEVQSKDEINRQEIHSFPVISMYLL